MSRDVSAYEVTLADVAEQVTERWEPGQETDLPYIGLEHLGQGSGTVIGQGRSGDVASAKTRFRVNDVLFGKLRPNLRKSALARSDGVSSTDIIILRAKENIDARFLFYSVSSEDCFEYAVRSSAGTKMPRTSWSEMADYPFFLPPLPEQRRIAEILSSVDEAIQATEAVIEQTQKVTDGMLESLLTSGTGHTEFQQTEIGLIPRGWEVKPLGEIADFVNGRGFKPHEWGIAGLPIIRIQNLNGSSFFNYFDGTFAPKLLVSPGDLLFAWSGSRGTSFGPHIWAGPKGLLNYHTWRVQLHEPSDRDFIYFALRRLTETIEADSHGASALVHMQKRAVVDYRIPFPPAAERIRIAEVLLAHEESVRASREELASLRNTKHSLMSDLLTGRKRVTGTMALAAE